jgi:hypothetical protein
VRLHPGGSSLARFLAERRGVPHDKDLPALTTERIRARAEAHRRRTGAWPILRSGPIPEAPDENWQKVDGALWKGYRGLPGVVAARPAAGLPLVFDGRCRNAARPSSARWSRGRGSTWAAGWW